METERNILDPKTRIETILFRDCESSALFQFRSSFPILILYLLFFSRPEIQCGATQSGGVLPTQAELGD